MGEECLENWWSINEKSSILDGVFHRIWKHLRGSDGISERLALCTLLKMKKNRAYHSIQLIKKSCKPTLVVPTNSGFWDKSDSEPDTGGRIFKISEDFRRFSTPSANDRISDYVCMNDEKPILPRYWTSRGPQQNDPQHSQNLVHDSRQASNMSRVKILASHRRCLHCVMHHTHVPHMWDTRHNSHLK